MGGGGGGTGGPGCTSGFTGFGIAASSGCERKMSRPVPLYVTSSLDFSKSNRRVGSSVCASTGRAVLRVVCVLPARVCKVVPVDEGCGADATGPGAGVGV